MLIEFVGNSGSGKSTVSRAVADELGLEVVPLYDERGATDRDNAENKWVKRTRLVAATLARSDILLRTRSIVRATTTPYMESHMGHLPMTIARKTTFADRIRTGVIDEGPLHYACLLLSYAVDSDTDSEATYLAARIRRPDVVVWLHCDPRSTAERVRRRSQGGTDPDHPYNTLSLERITDIAARYDRAAGTIAGRDAVKIDTTDLDTPAIVAELVRRIT